MAPAPRDIKILWGLIGILDLLGGMGGPFKSSMFQVDLKTAAFFGSMINSAMLLGSMIFSRVSDKYSRLSILWVVWVCQNIPRAAYPFFPSYVLQLVCVEVFFGFGGMAVFNALIGDHAIANKASPADVTSWNSYGMLLKSIAGIIAPILGTALLSSLMQAQLLLLFGALLCTPLLFLISEPPRKESTKQWTLTDYINIKSAREPAGLWYLSWTFMMVFIFNVCETILYPSLSGRFNADSAMFGQLGSVTNMGLLVGTLLVAPIFRAIQNQVDLKYVISCFMLFTFTARTIQFTATSWKVYLFGAFMFMTAGGGFITPIRNSLPTQFVPSLELGGFLGVKAGVESFSGVVGPMLAGLIGLSISVTPLSLMMLALYACTPLYGFVGYPRYLAPAMAKGRKD